MLLALRPGIFGDNMAPDEERDAETTHADRGNQPDGTNKQAIPDSWSLTKQQKAFIDLFSQDDDESNDKKS